MSLTAQNISFMARGRYLLRDVSLSLNPGDPEEG